MGEPESLQRELMALRTRAEAGPDDAEAWYQLGSALDSAGHEPEATRAYERVFALGIDRLAEELRPQLFVQAGSTLRNLGRLDEARTLLDQGRKQFPTFRALGAFLALVEISAGENRRAIDLLFDALLDHPEDDYSIRRYHRSLRWYADHLDEDRRHT
jgi:tetratricopeptide (TPR) repeat protein